MSRTYRKVRNDFRRPHSLPTRRDNLATLEALGEFATNRDRSTAARTVDTCSLSEVYDIAKQTWERRTG